MRQYDFILIPNYMLRSLEHLSFDCAINVASFQEMRTEQCAAYLDFIKTTCKGCLYSWNQERQGRNKEIATPVSKMLFDRFEVKEVVPPSGAALKKLKRNVKIWLKKCAALVGLIDPIVISVESENQKYREFICTTHR